MAINSKLKFAVIGFGHIGRRHATIINQYEGCALVAVVDPSAEAINHSLYPEGVQSFNSLDAMYESGLRPDVVNIATPNGLHCTLAVKALKRGSHVVVEKPMGLSRAECEEVIFTALQVSKQVFVVKQNRYSPPSSWLKDIVSSGTIGKVLMVQVNCYWNRDDRYYKKGGWKGTKDLDGG